MTTATTDGKRFRRTKAAVQEIKASIERVLLEDKPMTLRQVYYRLVSAGAIDKTEAQYKFVGKLLCKMRLEEEIPHGWIVDNTRFMRKPKTHSTLANGLRYAAENFRRAVWDNQDAYVEVWLEKDALSGVLSPTTSAWDVPLMVTRGYPSLSFLFEAAQAIRAHKKPTFLYYLGDHDPSGVDIPKSVQRGIRKFAKDTDITFKRIAVNPDQIEAMNLPTRPTKTTDSRKKGFEGESVEVDAIPPRDLKAMVKNSIVRHIDHAAYQRLKQLEAAEKATVRDIAGADWDNHVRDYLDEAEAN